MYSRPCRPHPRSFDARYEAGLQAKELLLKTNYKLVMAVCKPYIGKGHSLQDLISEGLRGLLRGVEKFDTSKGFRFSTYAHWWIRQAVSRSMAEQGRIVRCARPHAGQAAWVFGGGCFGVMDAAWCARVRARENPGGRCCLGNA